MPIEKASEQNVATAQKVSDKLFSPTRTTPQLQKFLTNWMQNDAAVSLQPEKFNQLKGNMAWLLKGSTISEGKRDEVQALIKGFIAGMGAGKTGLQTLNNVLTDMQLANLTNIDAATFQRFMVYEEGNVEGAKRKADVSGTKSKTFSVELGLKLGSISVLSKKDFEAHAQAKAQAEKNYSSATTREERIAELQQKLNENYGAFERNATTISGIERTLKATSAGSNARMSSEADPHQLKDQLAELRTEQSQLKQEKKDLEKELKGLTTAPANA